MCDIITVIITKTWSFGADKIQHDKKKTDAKSQRSNQSQAEERAQKMLTQFFFPWIALVAFIFINVLTCSVCCHFDCLLASGIFRSHSFLTDFDFFFVVTGSGFIFAVYPWLRLVPIKTDIIRCSRVTKWTTFHIMKTSILLLISINICECVAVVYRASSRSKHYQIILSRLHKHPQSHTVWRCFIRCTTIFIYIWNRVCRPSVEGAFWFSNVIT